MEQQREKIMVGLSGGVDSSVSAALLQQAGHQVIGVFIRTWQPDWMTCTWREDRRDAMRVAAHLGIPFLECNLEDAYRTEVAEYMINSYRQGLTPNPDVMCNKTIKFGGFLEWARAQGVKKIATGHYARVAKQAQSYQLLRGADEGKDQSYFLWTLTEQQLAATEFPVGVFEKDHVRKLAQQFGLPTATRPDSQGVCFLGEIDMKEFLGHYIETAPGAVLSLAGKVIGRHEGAVLYTIGERHGFKITDPQVIREPHYVIKKDLARNTLTVATSTEYQKNQQTQTGSRVRLEEVNLIGEIALEPGQYYDCQIRYHGKILPVVIERYDTTTGFAEVVLPQPATLARGQSLVFYDGERCLGGGVMTEITH